MKQGLLEELQRVSGGVEITRGELRRVHETLDARLAVLTLRHTDKQLHGVSRLAGVAVCLDEPLNRGVVHDAVVDQLSAQAGCTVEVVELLFREVCGTLQQAADGGGVAGLPAAASRPSTRGAHHP